MRNGRELNFDINVKFIFEEEAAPMGTAWVWDDGEWLNIYTGEVLSDEEYSSFNPEYMPKKARRSRRAY